MLLDLFITMLVKCIFKEAKQMVLICFNYMYNMSNTDFSITTKIKQYKISKFFQHKK